MGQSSTIRVRMRHFCNHRRYLCITVSILLVLLIVYNCISRPVYMIQRTGRREPLASIQYNLTGYVHVVVPEHIPRIIHQTWKSRHVPERLQPWVESWLRKHGKGWQYWFWSDADIQRLVAKKYPQFLRLFDSYPTDGYRADVFRYFVLYEYGGVYTDLDMECLRPLDQVLHAETCVISQEPLQHAYLLSDTGAPLVSNALMACKPQHPFFASVLAGLPSYTGLFYWMDILHATGPVMLTEMYHRYRRRSPLEAQLKLATPDTFQPIVDTSMIDHMRDKCVHTEMPSMEHAQVCKLVLERGFRTMPATESYTNHHWTHLWAGRLYDPLGVFNSQKTFDISLIAWRRPTRKLS